MAPHGVAKAFMDIFFPPLCPLCFSDIGASSKGLCLSCAGLFAARLIKGPLCLICGIPFRDGAGGEHTCGACIKTPPSFVMARSVYAYEDEVREAVHELKYKWGTMLGPLLGRLMGRTAEKMDFTADMVMPVPLHKNKMRKRGFNQSVILARHIAVVLSCRLNVTNLVRIRATPSQVGLAGDERRKNMRGAFKLSNADFFKGTNILLVDDVFTTGSTVGECALVLKRAGARVAVITLARV